MSSDSIYPHQPFFYVIRHKSTGYLYMGSKWANSISNPTSPKLFMVPNGYTTSSDVVNYIIAEEGLDAFETVEIVLEESVKEFGSIFDYEQFRLNQVNARYNPQYMNKTNGTLTKSINYKFDDLIYRKLVSNDSDIRFTEPELAISWLFDIDNLYYPTGPKKKNTQQVKQIDQFLKTRAYTRMRPSEVGLPNSYIDWLPDVLETVYDDLTNKFGTVLSVQRKRRQYQRSSK